jgi:hypothetical protein
LIFKTINRFIELKIRTVLRTAIAEPTSIDFIALRAKERAAGWIEANIDGAMLFSDRPKIQNYAAELASRVSGDVLELGVYKGVSLKRFSAKLRAMGSEKELFGIDSFEGLHNEWTNIDHLNAFDQNGVAPNLNDPRITLITGLVEDVLESFLETKDWRFSLLHFDMDLGKPTLFALKKLRPYLNHGTLLLFDNFHSYPGWEQGEFKAFESFIGQDDYQFVAFGPYQCLIRYGHN